MLPNAHGKQVTSFLLTAVTLTRTCSYDEDDIVTVLVGPNMQRFAVHKDVICKGSEFFRAACSTRWLEGQEKLVRLPEVRPNVFQVYLDWAYTGILAVEDAQTPEVDRGRSSGGIIDVYLLGDVLGDVKLRNQAMQLLNTHVSEWKIPSIPSICKIFENTPANSKLRDWAVDITIMRQSRQRFSQATAYYPAEFLSQIAVKLLHEVPVVTSRNALRETLSAAKYFEVEAGAPELEN